MTKKQSSWIWFLLAVMPIAITIMSVLPTTELGNIDYTLIIESFGFDVDVNTTTDMQNKIIAKNEIYFVEPNEKSLEGIITKLQKNLMPNIGGETASYFTSQYIAYIIRLYIIKIAFDVFLLLPKICNRLINKAIGSSEVE